MGLRNEKERKGKKTERCLRYSPFFSDILHFSPEMTGKTSELRPKTTENDRENGSSGKRSRNEFLGNSTIFHSFSSKIPRFSPIFSDILRYSLIFSIIFPNFAVFLHNILRYEKVKNRY